LTPASSSAPLIGERDALEIRFVSSSVSRVRLSCPGELVVIAQEMEALFSLAAVLGY
jgi:hypothetical protein